MDGGAGRRGVGEVLGRYFTYYFLLFTSFLYLSREVKEVKEVVKE